MTASAQSRRGAAVGAGPAQCPGSGSGAGPKLLRSLWAFGGISGLGWCLDTALFAVLVHAVGLAAGVSNIISAGLAVLFVFLASHERIFDGPRQERHRHLLVYALCQVLLVLAASWLVGVLVAQTELEPVLVKVGVTPLTFAANFVVMSRISRWSGPVSADGGQA